MPNLQEFQKVSRNVCGEEVIAKLVGTNNPNLIEERFKQTSPQHMLPLGIKQVLIYGSEDPTYPLALVNDYQHQARKKGDIVEVITIKGIAHHGYAVPNSLVWPALINSIVGRAVL